MMSIRPGKASGFVLACALSLAIVGCGQATTSSATSTSNSDSVVSAQQTSASDSSISSTSSFSSTETQVTSSTKLADGTYSIEAKTDSSMFHAYSCTLTVADGVYTAELVLLGEGFSRLYYGTAEDAASADPSTIYDYHLNDEGKYTFDLPVEALNEELTIAAYGQRRDRWYDHKITFLAPDAQ